MEQQQQELQWSVQKGIHEVPRARYNTSLETGQFCGESSREEHLAKKSEFAWCSN